MTELFPHYQSTLLLTGQPDGGLCKLNSLLSASFFYSQILAGSFCPEKQTFSIALALAALEMFQRATCQVQKASHIQVLKLVRLQHIALCSFALVFHSVTPNGFIHYIQHNWNRTIISGCWVRRQIGQESMHSSLSLLMHIKGIVALLAISRIGNVSGSPGSLTDHRTVNICTPALQYSWQMLMPVIICLHK